MASAESDGRWSIIGLRGSETKACNTWLSIGNFMSSFEARWAGITGDGKAYLFAADLARAWVSTMVIRLPFFLKPVTSQFWMISTPSRSAPPG